MHQLINGLTYQLKKQTNSSLVIITCTSESTNDALAEISQHCAAASALLCVYSVWCAVHVCKTSVTYLHACLFGPL